jgi:hypothetical protein
MASQTIDPIERVIDITPLQPTAFATREPHAVAGDL